MLGHIPIRRLSRVEYGNTVRDLFGGLAIDRPEIPADQTEAGFENASRHLSPSPLLVERHELTAMVAAYLGLGKAATAE